eukprot:TRINITY_DN1838_c0_g1_i1.p3 TRINITY_DN1838_c0_g1~~TRINITY_DN1838_c0_g1_i1.p3  ORF type:complete len:238 (+),score=86.40 TRINITY_DN1838_c0_g1_i1:61-714(+)
MALKRTSQDLRISQSEEVEDYPLLSEWSFWSESGVETKKEEVSFEEKLKLGTTVASVKSFWQSFNFLFPSRLGDDWPFKSSYHIMRSSAKPTWEDCPMAGQWFYRIPREPKEFANALWEGIVLAAIGESFQLSGDDTVIGISISNRDIPRSPDKSATLIIVWNTNTTEFAQRQLYDEINRICQAIISEFPEPRRSNFRDRFNSCTKFYTSISAKLKN